MNENNPYASPHAVIHSSTHAGIEVPEEITTPIRHGCIAAIVAGTILSISTLAAIAFTSESNLSVAAWNFVDIALVFALAFGVYRKSRTAAVMLVIYLILSQILIMVSTGMPRGVVLAIVLLIFYSRAVVGTFRYHRFIHHAKRHPPEVRSRLSDDPYFNQQARKD